MKREPRQNVRYLWKVSEAVGDLRRWWATCSSRQDAETWIKQNGFTSGAVRIERIAVPKEAQ